jgi:cystathionine beta-lyase/cystathionine gamma-synthase
MEPNSDQAFSVEENVEMGFSTRAAHLRTEIVSETQYSRPAVTPVYQTSVYEFATMEALEDFNKGKGSKYWYGRYGLPNQTLLSDAVAQLEGFDEGIVCSSGMSAITSALLSLGSMNCSIIALSDTYGGTYSVLRSDLPRFGMAVTFVESTDELISHVEREGRREHADSVIAIVETETNPTLKIPDLPAISKACRKSGAVLVVDNTFPTPYNCRPKKFGADLVVHSATKFLGGHDDLTLGIVAADSERLEKIREFAIRTGLTSPSAWESWLCLRSLRTLGLRMRRANENALTLARFLSEQPERVSKVIYPGLRSHPNYESAKQIFVNGSGALLSFELKGGYTAVKEFVRKVKLVKLVPSLGSIKTTVSYPSLTSHRSVPIEKRLSMGITDGFLRVSVGIEDEEDLLRDFECGIGA